MPRNSLDVTLTEDEIMEIVRLLDFASLASKVAMTNTNSSEKEMKTYIQNINNAQQLGDTLIASLDIGHVDKDSVN